MTKTILVTGAAGFIGCNFVRYMIKNYSSIKIISYDNLSYAGKRENLPKDDDRHFFIKGDICDRETVEQTLRDYQIDTIIHFAAESHVDNSIADPAIFVHTNVVGTFVLLDAAKQFWIKEQQLDETQCRFHHVSTDEVYGQLDLNDPAFTEEVKYNPRSPYSASKASSDHFVRAYYYTYGLPITLSNCSNNYGPYQNNEKLIPTVIRHCMNQTPIPVYGNGSNIRDWLYVTDHCHAIDTILRKGKVGENYNIGGCCEINNLELVKKICALIDEIRPINKRHDELIQFVKDRPGHDWRYAIDNKKISEKLGWSASCSLESSLRDTVVFFVNELFSNDNK